VEDLNFGELQGNNLTIAARRYYIVMEERLAYLTVIQKVPLFLLAPLSLCRGGFMALAWPGLLDAEPFCTRLRHVLLVIGRKESWNMFLSKSQ
jgi:hypothetical protein